MSVNYNPSYDDIANASHPNNSYLKIETGDGNYLFAHPYQTTFSDTKSGQMKGSVWYPLFSRANTRSS